MMQILKIMLVLSSISGGGAELVVSNLCRGIDRKRFNVSVLHLRDRGEKGEWLSKQGFGVIGLPPVRKRWEAYLRSLKLRRVVLNKRIDLLHSHNVEPLIECALCKLATPSVKWVHTYHFGNYPHLPLRYLLTEGLLSRMADKLVAVGLNQRLQIASTYRLKSDRIETVYNGIELHNKNETGSHGKREIFSDRIVIGSVSTLIRQKGLDSLLEVAQAMMHRNAKVIFWVVGDGPLRPDLEKRKRKMGLDQMVKFLGWVPNAAQSILPHIDIFLQMSRWEAMSMVILEAMAAGKPIVSTDVGENRRILQSAGAGFIVPYGDIGSAVANIEKLTDSPDLRRIMGENGEKAVRNNFTVAGMARKYEKIYSNVLQVD